jgi:hypothetical protein
MEWVRSAIARGALALAAVLAATSNAAVQQSPLPSGPIAFGGFAGEFRADGTFAITGQGWPAFIGTWKAAGPEVVLVLTKIVKGCEGDGRYSFHVSGTRVTFSVIDDACVPRRMILDRSTWRPAGEADTLPVRAIVHTAAAPLPELPPATPSAHSWPMFRGARASGVADGQNLPDRWDVKTGENIRWRTPIPGLAHSSPVVWGSRVFVTSAISSVTTATFKPGLYGDGDASTDRSPHRFVLYAVDARTGKILWERIAAASEPRNKRHIKNTYASALVAGVLLARLFEDVAAAPTTVMVIVGLTAVAYAATALRTRPIVTWAVTRTLRSLPQLLPMATRACLASSNGILTYS